MEKKLQPLKNKLLLFFFLLCVLPKLYSQTVAGDYTFSYTTGTTYSDFTSVYNIPTSTWDDQVATAPIGFNFYFNGSTYTNCYINTNGYITFGAASATNNYSPISSNAGYSGAIAGFARDLHYSGSNNTNQRVQYRTTGSAPNRIFTVQWRDARRYNYDGKFNFQIKLYEGSNTIEVHYGPNSEGTSSNPTNNTNRPVQVGLRGATNADFNNRTTTTDWSNSSTGTANDATNATTATVRPVPNSIYRWTLTQYTNTVSLAVNGTYTVPCGPTQLIVEAWGAGGAGGKATNAGSNGGGGGGAYAKRTMSVSAGDQIAYTIGAGGSASGDRNGGDTWFGSPTNIMAKGGKGVADNTLTGGIGGQASESFGDVKYDGGKGGNGISGGHSGGGGGAATVSSAGGNGTASAGGTSENPGGDGGRGARTDDGFFLFYGFGPGASGSSYGGGGGGGRAILGWIDQNGGNGANGLIRVSYSYPNTGTPPPITAITAVSSDPTDDIGCTSDMVTLQSTGGNTGAGVSTLWYQGSTCPSFAYIQEFMGSTYTTYQTTIGNVNNGNRTFTATGNDPNIDMQNVLSSAIDPALHKYIVIRYRVVSGGGTTQIYFKKNSLNLTEGRSVSQALLSDGQWHIMTINMSGNTEWSNTGGNITGWRFDYASLPGTIMEIDYLALSSVPILENTNADDTLINVITTAENTTFGSLRIADQAALCNGAIPYTTCIPAMIHRSDRTFTATTGDWDVATNWNFSGVPNSSNCVFINDNRWVHVNTPSAVAKTIRVSEFGKVNISANNALTVTNAIINQGNGDNFVVESDASLKQLSGSTGINHGNITVHRNLDFTGARNEYNYLSTPVTFASGQSYKTIYPGVTSANYPSVLYYVESTRYFLQSSGANILGRSSAVKEAGTLSGITNNRAEFKGVPYVGDFTYPLAYSSTGLGFNLVGNPYPSNVDLQVLYSHNSSQIEPDFRFWDNKANDNGGQQHGAGYNGRAYARYNAVSNIGNEAGYYLNTSHPIIGSKKPNKILKVGQGMMVQALGSGKSLSWNNAPNVKTVDNADSVFFGKTSPDNRYWLTMKTPDNLILTAAFTYIPELSNAFEKGDSKVTSGESDSFYSMTSDAEKVVINARSIFNPDDVVPLGTTHYAAGIYTISLGDHEGIFANGQNVYLKDKELNIVTNLSEGPYSFTSNSGQFTNRFEIVYLPQTTLDVTGFNKESVQIYRDGEDFVVKASTKNIKDVELYEMSGKLIFKKSSATREVRINAAQLANGIYMVKAYLENGEVTTKKVRY